MRILVRCEASNEMGGGHAMRCFALAQAARDLGHSVIFAMAEGHDTMFDRCRQEHIELLKVPAPAGSAKDIEWSTLCASRQNVQSVIVDGPGLRRALAAHLAPAGLKVMLIDDEGFADSLSNVTVLNPNIWASDADYPVIESERLLLGAKAVLLRREFRAPSLKRTGSSLRVLVTLGASDPTDFTTAFLGVLAECEAPPACRFDVIIGPMNRRSGSNLVYPDYCDVHFHSDPPNLVELMDSAHLALSAAGGTLWELYRRGIPTVPVVTAENQRRNVEWLVANGMAEKVIETPGPALASLLALAGDEIRRRKLSVAGQNLIDGQGVARAIAALEA